MYMYATLSFLTWLWHIFVPVGSNNNAFDSIADLYNIVTFTRLCLSLSYICYLLIENKSWVSWYTSCTLMWDILRLPCQIVCVTLFLEDKDKMIWRMKIIAFIFRITCASRISCLGASGYDLGWDLEFELVLEFDIVMGTPVGYPLEYSISILIGLALGTSFCTWEVYLFEVSLGKMGGFIIGNGEGCLFGLALILILGSPIESPNYGYVLPATLLGAPLVLWFGSESFSRWCSCRWILYFNEDTCRGVGISCVPPSGTIFLYIINSVRYFQLF